MSKIMLCLTAAAVVSMGGQALAAKAPAANAPSTAPAATAGAPASPTDAAPTSPTTDPTTPSPTTGTAPTTPDPGPATTPDTPATPTTPSTATTGAATDTAATAAPTGLAVGVPVKDNTGATIGSISELKPDASGQENVTIAMGSDRFAVASTKLAFQNGAATINLTQAQITDMLHKPK